MWCDPQENSKATERVRGNDSAVHGLGKEKTKAHFRKTPSDSEEKLDMAQGSVFRMVRHVTTV